MMGLSMKWTSKVTECEPNVKWAKNITCGSMIIDEYVTYSTSEGYVKFTILYDMKAGGIMRLFTPMIVSTMRKETIKSLKHIYSPENKDNAMASMALAGVELYVLGSASWQGFKAHKVLWMSEKAARGRGIFRTLASLVPGTKSWRFVMRSTLTGPAVPLFKAKCAGPLPTDVSHDASGQIWVHPVVPSSFQLSVVSQVLLSPEFVLPL